jgi:DNA-binding transcriptional LysR family regulator
MMALCDAAVSGVGIVQLPKMMIGEQLASGKLICLLPEWAPRREIIHVVFPSRRGVLPSVRALIDYLAEHFQALGED